MVGGRKEALICHNAFRVLETLQPCGGTFDPPLDRKYGLPAAATLAPNQQGACQAFRRHPKAGGYGRLNSPRISF